MLVTDDIQRTAGSQTELEAREEIEARLADALNRLAFREAELAALAPDGVAPPRRVVLMARVAELEQAIERQQRELQELRKVAKARKAELVQARGKLKVLAKGTKVRQTEPVRASAKGKSKALPKGTKARPTEPVPAKAKSKPKALAKSTKVRESELDQAKPKPKALAAALEQLRSTGLWKAASRSVLAAGKSLGITTKWRKGGSEREKLQRQIEVLTASALFDRDWYLAKYPDVAESGIDPAKHYLRHGAADGRDPGPRFSTRKYLEQNPDVVRAGMNPLLHYLKFGLAEGRRIFAADANGAVGRAAASVPHAVPPAAATVFSLPSVPRKEVAWLHHEGLGRRQGRTTLELQGTILGWLPSSEQMVGTDSLASLSVIGGATLFCRMMRLGDAHALSCFDGPTEIQLPPADLRRVLLGCPFLPNGESIDLADAWFASGRDLRLRFSRPTPVLRFFQWDRHAGQLALLSETQVQASNGLADVPTIDPLSPILIAASDADGVLEGLLLLPFPSLCRGGYHHGELLAGEGASLMERLRTLSAALVETWLTGDQGAFTVGRIDIDLANASGSEIIFSRAMQLWLHGCFDIRCRSVNGSAIADGRSRQYLEERLGVVKEEVGERSERERSASCALQLDAHAIPSLQAIVARGALPVGSAGWGASIMVDSATGKPRCLIDVARLDANLLEKQWLGGPRFPRLVPLREGAGQVDELPRIDARPGFALALTAGSDSAARTRFATGGRLIRNASVRPEISVLCPYLGDESRFAALLDSLRLQTDVTNLEVIVTAPSQRLASGTSVEGLLRRFFPDGQVIICDDGTLPGVRLNLMAERARCDRLLVAAGVMLHDPSTLYVLRHIAEDEKAATASCVLRSVAANAAAVPARLHCAGFYPDGAEEPDGVVAAFARLDSRAPLGNWTYPMAANPPPLFMTRETMRRELGGFNETLSDLAAVAIDFAVKATTRGYAHVCTSRVAATVIDEAIAMTPRAISLPSAAPPLAWRDAAARSVVVRTLVT